MSNNDLLQLSVMKICKVKCVEVGSSERKQDISITLEINSIWYMNEMPM